MLLSTAGFIIHILVFSADITTAPAFLLPAPAPRFSRYLADDGELRSVDVVAVNPKREHRGQRHHAAHRRHVVQVRLRVLDVAGAAAGFTRRRAQRQKTNPTVIIYPGKVHLVEVCVCKWGLIVAAVSSQTVISSLLPCRELHSFHLNVIILMSCVSQSGGVLIRVKY